ncbi:hypothetical protein [Streptomyces flaveolus]|uniref:hypothetical protein n=1 Tax=Streptomyces flaveolus TaxID=67297 RepID=UPI0038267E43
MAGSRNHQVVPARDRRARTDTVGFSERSDEAIITDEPIRMNRFNLMPGSGSAVVCQVDLSRITGWNAMDGLRRGQSDGGEADGQRFPQVALTLESTHRDVKMFRTLHLCDTRQLRSSGGDAGRITEHWFRPYTLRQRFPEPEAAGWSSPHRPGA